MNWVLHLRILMFLQGILYASFGTFALFFHNIVMDIIGLNQIEAPFWVLISVSLLYTLAVICFEFSVKPEKYGYVLVVIYAKFIDSALMLVTYFTLSSIVYLYGCLIDFFLGLHVLIYYVFVKRST